MGTKVFSTYVEMILSHSGDRVLWGGILHVCGDDPYPLKIRLRSLVVFSTYVEMILLNKNYFVSHESILHVCGDDPYPLHLDEYRQ